MKGTVSEVIVAILKKYDVKYVFGLCAAQVSGVMDALGRDPYFEYVTTRHEECAAHMAHGAAKATGSLACCFGTVGPGASNLVPGVAAAFNDNVPILVITGDNQLRDLRPGRDLLQELDQLALYKPITKFGAMLDDPGRVPELVVRALRTALSGRPGPVHLDMPCDIAMLPCECDLDSLPPTIEPPASVPTEQQIDQAVALLSEASRPLLLVGGGVNRSDAQAEVRELLGITGITATATFNAKGVVEPGYPAYLGAGGVIAGEAMLRASREADVILAVGCKFSSWVLIGKEPNYSKPEGQKIIHLDVEPQAIGKNVAVDLALLGDAKETLALINDALNRLPRKDDRCVRADLEWCSSLRADYAKYRSTLDEVAAAVHSVVGGGELLNQAAVAKAVSEELPADAIVCFDGGQTMEWCHSYVHPLDGRSSFYNPGMGHLGTGLPFANAAKLVNRDRTVVCLTGDGAFGLTAQELETSARAGLEILVIVCNDSHWGMYRMLGEQIYQNPNFGSKLTDVDFSLVAKGFGCDGEKVTDLTDLRSAVRRGLAAGKPYVVDVVVDWTPHPMDACWGDGIFPDWTAALVQAVEARAEKA